MRVLMLLAVLPLAACSIGAAADEGGIAGSGSGTTRSFAATDFTGVSLRGSDDVEVTTGGAFAVRAEGPAEVLDRLKIERDGDTLKIGRKRDANFNWGSYKGARIFVTMPSIAKASIAGSGDLSVNRVASGDFEGSTAGSGSLSIGAMSVANAALSIAGSGDISAKGTAETLKLSIAGSGDIDASGVKAKAADASIAGSGSISADVNGKASVSILGSGDANMGANAVCQISKMGSGTVTCGK